VVEGRGGDRLPARDKQLVTLAQTEGWGLPLDVCRGTGRFMNELGEGLWFPGFREMRC